MLYHIKNKKEQEEVINLFDECEMRVESKKLGITMEELQNAIAETGPVLQKVEDFIRQRARNTMTFIMSSKCID